MNVLIVHAHHEPKSFSSALSRQAAETLRSAGHEVTVSDLYAEGFDPVSDRRNFQSVFDANYLKQQNEERHASDVNGFAADLEREIARLEACDLLIFSFPLWWFGMPAILKGWVDRAFPMERVYGGAKLYENGLGQSKKRAMVIFTVGGGAEAYSGRGVNPPLESVLAPIEHGVFSARPIRRLCSASMTNGHCRDGAPRKGWLIILKTRFYNERVHAAVHGERCIERGGPGPHLAAATSFPAIHPVETAKLKRYCKERMAIL
jgi:NAD(P)H dehydrogenase (quinone)